MDDTAPASDFEMRRRLLQMEMLHEVGVAISESLDPAYVAQEVLQRALTMVDARAGGLLVDAADGLAVAGKMALPIGDQELLRLAGDAAASGAAPTHVSGNGEAWKHLCLVPLQSRNRVVGVLAVADRETRDGTVGPFGAEDVALLQSFAAQAGAALHNARLHRDVEEAYGQLQAAQRKLAQLEQLRALGDLAAEIAHAMRHILGVIIGRADTYLTFPRDPEGAVRTIMETAEGGQQLIDRLQHCTRLGVGRQRQLLSLHELLDSVIQDVRVDWDQRAAATAPVEWVVELAPVPATYANPVDLREALANLLVNALEAMPDGGQLRTTLELREQTLVTVIRDTGCGMAAAVRDQCFRPFFTTKDESGTGLGLSIAYRIVDDHDGEIAVDTAPGAGTAVTVRLPLCLTAPTDEDGDDGAADLGG